MQINKNRLKNLWKSRDGILRDNVDNKIVQRFEWLQDKVDNLLKISVNINDTDQVTVDDVTLSRNTKSFGPIHNGNDTLTDNAHECLKKLKEKVKELTGDEKLSDFAEIVWKFITGTPEDSKTRDSLFRIFSNGRKDSIHTLTCGVNVDDYYFASNNYFFHIIRFLQEVQNNPDAKYGDIVGDNNGQIPLVLTYDGAMQNPQRDELGKRFVLKFLWMWANKENVIALPSLQIMRNFCDSALCKEIIDGNKDIEIDGSPRKLIIKGYDDFIAAWKVISDDILTTLGLEDHNRNDENVKVASKLLSCVLYDYDTKNILDLILSGCKSVILYGAPGTGKTYEAKRVVVEMLELEAQKAEHSDAMEQALEEVQFPKCNDKGSWTLHPSYSYEDFIGGIRPDVNDKNDVIYKLEPGKFKTFCEKAKKAGNDKKKFIFIIDEINRSNLSAVFGELLYCLEYRDREISLPYFKERFSIPDNVYLIGTMNDVDKSLQIFDRALRRRFYFYHHKPNMNVVRSVLCDDFDEDSLEEYVRKCKELNQKITKELHLEENYQIGHAYFLKIKDFFPGNQEKVEISHVELEKLWDFSLLPLLEEYLGNRFKTLKAKLNSMKEDFLK